MSEVDAEAMHAALAVLCRAATDEFAMEDMLRRLCDVAASAIDVDGAAVTIVNADGTMRFVHAEGAADIVPLEKLQELLQWGPCRDAVEEQSEVVVDNILVGHEERWPEYVVLADQIGLSSTVALPLVSRDRTWGVLDLYKNRPGSWSESALASARLLADTAVSFIVMAADRDAARRAERELVHRSLHDDLTGLPNRALLFDRLTHALASANRRETSVAVFFIDLDHFKQINDTLGHAAGDTVLCVAGSRMAASLRAEDTLARLAGDEFVVVCEDLPHQTTAQLNGEVAKVMQRLHDVLVEPIPVEEVKVAITASIGAALSTSASTPDDLLGDADAAMYAAKMQRKTGLVIQEIAGRFNRQQRRLLERDLIRALNRDELELYYQPIVSSDDRVTVAVEALLRWNHPEHGLLPAAVFIDLAERTGTVQSIGRWVVDQACAQLAEWRHHLDGTAPQTCYVNLSPRELADPSLDGALIAALDHHHVEPEGLGLEIVESAFTDELLLPALTRHHQRGHPLSVDDFGTGYSSLSRLVELPVDIAKIDRSFIADLSHEARRHALIEAIVVVARHLNLQLIGEGVETEAQAAYLDAAGCDLLQGFHTGAPQPARQLTHALATAAPELTD